MKNIKILGGGKELVYYGDTLTEAIVIDILVIPTNKVHRLVGKKAENLLKKLSKLDSY